MSAPTHTHNEQEYQEQLKANQTIFYEKYDPEFTINLSRSVVNTINDVFFRAEYIGFDQPIERNNPKHPVILAGNHSGMAFPWDAMIFGSGMLRKMNYDTSKVCRALASPMLSQATIMAPYLIRDLWKKIGGIDATYFNFETMLHYPDANILIYPEGIDGIGKGWNRRYQLQRFATSFIRMSLKYKTDIVPVLTINGENINPHTYSFNWVNRLSKKIGIPFIPIGILILLLPLQPWLFYYAWPAKLTYLKGKRISPHQWTDTPYDQITQEEINQIRDRVQQQFQEQLDQARQKYAHKPYQIRQHLRQVWQQRHKFPYYLPWGWLFLFHEFIRRWNKRQPNQDIHIPTGIGSLLRILYHNPFTIWYFIPIIGWIPIIYRGIRGGIRQK